jgi:hypothetical protein
MSAVVTFVHEQSAQVNVVWATLPEQVAAPPSPKFTGGPPLAHLAGGGPSGTAGTQPPPTHPCPAGQAWPQPPQLALSLPVSTQALLHAVKPGMQLPAHALPEQTCVPEQTMPHPPQLFGSPVEMHLPLQ